MPSLTFPTRPHPDRDGFIPTPGQPARAGHCRCQPAGLLDHGRCVRCGRWTAQTIAATWTARAQQIARKP